VKFAVVTTYADRHWDVYVKRCMKSYRKYWSASIPLIAYEDQDLYGRAPWQREFKERHALRPTHDYRFDAVRFSHKVAAIELASVYADIDHQADVLVWMDADCVTHAPVDAAWLEGLLGDADFAYLSRKAKYPECGFMLFRLGSTHVRQLIRSVADLYRTDALFALREWHDSFAIEHCRARIPALRCVSLSGGAEDTAHPLVNGPLGSRLDHLKGKRKVTGRSGARDLRVKRTEVYWQ